MSDELKFGNKHNEFIIDIGSGECVKDVILKVPVEKDPILITQTNNFFIELALILLICKCKSH